MIVLGLFLNLRDDAPEGPGWYVWGKDASTDSETYIYVTPEQAIEFANLFGSLLLKIRPGNAQTPSQLIRQGNTLMTQELAKQLAFAEEQATRIPMLRKRLSTTEPERQDV